MRALSPFLLFCAIVAAGPAWAQGALKKADPCLVIEQEIVPLLPPNLDSAAPWKKTTGAKGEDKSRALMAVVDGGQIAIGESRSYDEKTGFGQRQIEMVRTDKTGKIVVNRFLPVKNLQAVVDAVLLKDRIIVLTQSGTNEKDSAVTLQFMNGVAELSGSAVLTEAGRHLIPKSLVVATGGEKIVVAALSISNTNPDDYNTVLFWVDRAGKQIAKKTYLPGVPNKPDFVGRMPNGGLIVTGRVMTEGNRDAGWVMRLSGAGDIIFQRPYARGADSTIRRAIAYGPDYIVTLGDTLPAGAGDKAAWLMKLDSKGNPVWQKYLTGKYNFSGIDMMAVADGRIQALIAGKPSTEGGREHARIITVSQTGQIINDEAFLEGSNAVPSRFIAQGGMRYLVGIAETGFSQAVSDESLKYVTYDMWLLGLTAMPEYQDSCGKAPDRILDDLP